MTAKLTFFWATLPLRIRNRISSKFNTTQRIFEPSEGGGWEQESLKIAIIALFPRPSLKESAIRLIGAFESSGYEVVLVINQSTLTEEWLEGLITPKRIVLVRKNLGRDFGAYKEGYLYLYASNLLTKASKLAFANDSIYYGEKSVSFVEKILSRDVPWNSMFVNYQFHTHSQSFFQVFDKEIIRKPYFLKFWRGYFPSDLRHLAINNGEVRLSRLTMNLGFTPDSFVNADRILNDSHFEGFTDEEEFALWSNFGLAMYSSEYRNFENSKLRLKRVFAENNPTHHAGLLASRTLGAPLKLDIIQTGQATQFGVHETLVSLGCDPEEIELILNSMLLKGTHASNRGFPRLWKSYGYI